MSQVVVTKDNLSAKRELSRAQENAIAKNLMYQKWRMADVNRFSLVTKAIGFALLPIVAVWGLLLALVGMSVSTFIFVMGFLGRMISFRKQL